MIDDETILSGAFRESRLLNIIKLDGFFEVR
jgi:hypothetical protein